MKTTVSLDLTAEQLNVVLVALGQMPYLQVHELIGEIQTQAGPQLVAAAHSGGAATPEGSAPDG